MAGESEFATEGGIPIKATYTPDDLKDWTYREKLGNPGEYPFARGITPTMYRDNLWQMNQYAGFATPDETNKWFKYLLGQGAKGLIAALDLPTQCGYGSDHPRARGEVGKQGVSLNSLADLEAIYDGIPLADVRFGSLANAISPIFLAWSVAMVEKRGLSPKAMYLSMQNDVLKEYGFRGTYIYPPKPSVKLTCDSVEYCTRNGFKNSQVISCCGGHFAESGATTVQEMAFTLADSVAYIEELISRGLSVDEFAPSMSVFLMTGMDLFEEVCKFRAFRRMWARMMKDRFRARDPRSMAAGFRSYTRGDYFTAQQPLNNIIRGTIGTLAAALGGVQTYTTASYDEALSLPSPEAITIALRTQQIVAYETGVTSTVDPLGGSYFVESLTNELEEKAWDLFEDVQKMGGAITAVETGFYEREIARSAYERAKRIESGKRVVVGVNRFVTEESSKIEIKKIDPAVEQRQIERIRQLRQARDNDRVKVLLGRVTEAAREGVNTVPSLIEAGKAYATISEMCDALRQVYGEHKRTRI